jgi:hypothetical protein
MFPVTSGIHRETERNIDNLQDGDPVRIPPEGELHVSQLCFPFGSYDVTLLTYNGITSVFASLHTRGLTGRPAHLPTLCDVLASSLIRLG